MPSECPFQCKGSDEILQLLIDNGANVNAVDGDGRTALDAALEANEIDGKFKNRLRLEVLANFAMDRLCFNMPVWIFYSIYGFEDREEVIRLLTQHGAERGGMKDL